MIGGAILLLFHFPSRSLHLLTIWVLKNSSVNKSFLSVPFEFYRLLHSNIAPIFYRQSSRGLVSTRHALWSRLHWIRCQNQPELHTLPLGGPWILLAETTEARRWLDHRVTPDRGVDKFITATPIFSLGGWDSVVICCCSHVYIWLADTLFFRKQLFPIAWCPLLFWLICFTCFLPSFCFAVYI